MGSKKPRPSLEQWGPVRATSCNSTCLPPQPAGSRPALPAGSDVLTSRDNVLLSWAPSQQCPTDTGRSAAKEKGVLQGCLGRLGSLRYTNKPNSGGRQSPCVLAWLHLSRERGRFSSQQRHFLLSQAPGDCVCLRGASFELAQGHRAHSPGPGSLTWHSFRQL